MPLREPWHQRSVVPTCKRGRNIGNDHAKRSLKTQRSLVRSACEGKLGNQKSVFRCNLTHVVAFCRLNRRFGPTFGVRNSHFSGGRIFKNALRTFESANWRDWICVSAIFRWSLLSGGRKDRFDCILIQSRDLAMIARWHQCGTMTSQILARASFPPSVWPSSRSNFDLGPSPSDSTEKTLSYQSLWFWSAIFL